MLSQDLSFAKTLNPSFPLLKLPPLNPFPNPPHKTLITLTLTPKPPIPTKAKLLSLHFNSHNPIPQFSRQNAPQRDVSTFAGRRKKASGGGGRIDGFSELRREARRNARRKSKQLVESFFYRLKNPNKNYADNFTESELQMIGLGYDRMVRFMDKDDPNLRHPYDWYKYGEYGPYSWRGVVVGDPIRGRFSDECVSMIGEVRDHESWEKIEQFEMAQDFGKRVEELDKNVGLRYFWVFVRHPRWRVSELPWQQWTLVAEVVLEAGKQRLDKWTLMGRLGNKARRLITQCAAWMRPDIIYVKKPVYQCRFEPQDNFFRPLTPFLDPRTEQDFLFELERDDGSVELCTYFGGLCKIVKANPKSFVDDVVKAYEKLSDEDKNKCLEFLLTNHPYQLLHPYTKEWKAKLEEEEMGCDAPDDEDEWSGSKKENEVIDWLEDDDGKKNDGKDGEDQANEDGEDQANEDDDTVVDMEGGGDDELGSSEDEDFDPEEDERFWEEEFKKAVNNSERMEKLAKRSMEISTKFYQKQFKEDVGDKKNISEYGDETAVRGKRAKVSPEEWKLLGYGPYRKKIKKSKIPPELFLKAAVRPFTYKNLVKEIVLTRHAILDGDIISEGSDK